MTAMDIPYNNQPFPISRLWNQPLIQRRHMYHVQELRPHVLAKPAVARPHPLLQRVVQKSMFVPLRASPKMPIAPYQADYAENNEHIASKAWCRENLNPIRNRSA